MSTSSINFDRTLTGQFIHQDEQTPITHKKVRLFAKNFFGIKKYLGSAETDKNGRFVLKYNWKPSIFNRTQDLVVGLVEKKRPFAYKGLYCASHEVPLSKIERRISTRKNSQSLGRIEINYAKIPSKITDVLKPRKSHKQSFRYLFKFLKAALPELIKRFIIFLFSRFLSAKQIDKIYQFFGPKYVVPEATSDHLLNVLLNEICAVDYQELGDTVIWNANWDGLKFDIKDSLPNVQIIAQKINQTLQLKEIRIKYRSQPQEIFNFDRLNLDAIKSLETHSIEELKKMRNDENKKLVDYVIKLKWFYYVSKSIFSLKGEAEKHLGIGHLLPGVVAKPFFKYISEKNPLYKIVSPHLSQLQFINWLGAGRPTNENDKNVKGVIFGKDSILEKSALTPDSSAQVIITGMKNHADYTKFKPLTPLSKKHVYAKAQSAIYNSIYSFLKDYVQENKEEICKYWGEIRSLSDSIHKRFLDIPKITENEQPSIDDIQRLVQLFSRMIHLTTFEHWAMHSRQHNLTSLKSSSLSMRHFARNTNGEFDLYGNTDKDAAKTQLFISRVLLNFEGDALVKDPYKNIYKPFLEYLTKTMKKIKGYPDIMKMHIATQI